MLQPPTANVKTRCHKTPLPSHNSTLVQQPLFSVSRPAVVKRFDCTICVFEYNYIGVVHIIIFTVLSQVDQPTAIQIL